MLLMFTFGWLDYPFYFLLFSNFFIRSHVTFILIQSLLFLKEEICLDFKLKSESLLLLLAMATAASESSQKKPSCSARRCSHNRQGGWGVQHLGQSHAPSGSPAGGQRATSGGSLCFFFPRWSSCWVHRRHLGNTCERKHT